MADRGSKSARTRQRVADVALELFERQGYDRTTTSQIAAAAAVSEMTLFRHFTSKAQLLLGDPYDPVIAAAVAAQPGRWAPLTRVVEGIRSAWQAIPAQEEDAVRRRMRIAARTPGLTGAVRANTRATEDAIARALSDTGTAAAAARIAATAVLAALMESLTQWAVADDELPLEDAIAFALLVFDEAARR
jgi:AcrR family transcriptional regulator